MRVDYFHSGGPKIGESVSLDRVVNDGPWPGSRTQLVDPTNLGDISSRCATRRRRRCSTRAASHRSTASGRRRPRRRRSHRTFHESLRFPWPRQPVTVVLSEAAGGQQLRPGVDRPRSTRRRGSSTRRRCRQHRRHRSGRCSRTGRRRRRSTSWSSARATPQAEMPKFHADVQRLLAALFDEEPFKSRRSDFNVRGAGPAVGAERRQPSERRRVPPHAAVGRIQHLRLRAVRPDARQPGAARRRVGGAVRVHRDSRQRQDLRRRRHLQRSGDGVGRQRVLAVRVRPRVRRITSRRWPTSTTRRTSPTRPARSRSRSRGSRTSPRCTIRRG